MNTAFSKENWKERKVKLKKKFASFTMNELLSNRAKAEELKENVQQNEGNSKIKFPDTDKVIN